MHRLFLFSLLLFAATGCAMFGSAPTAVPRYALDLPAAPPAAAAAGENAPVLVLGRVKAAASASRRGIVWSRLPDGRVGELPDGALALEPEETMAAALRTYLPGIGVYRAVVPREVAPRGRDRIVLETWIERFGLECDAQGATAAVMDVRFYLEPSSGAERAALREIPLSARIAVSSKKGALPTAGDAVAGLSKALESLLAKLRIELSR